jgi:hypothetical protein
MNDALPSRPTLTRPAVAPWISVGNILTLIAMGIGGLGFAFGMEGTLGDHTRRIGQLEHALVRAQDRADADHVTLARMDERLKRIEFSLTGRNVP